MTQESFLGAILLVLDISLQIAFVVRVLLRPHREPASRIAWVVVVVALPLLGILAYLLFGEKLDALSIFGMGVCAVGVVLVNRGAQVKSTAGNAAKSVTSEN